MSVPLLPQVVANKARHPRSGGHHPRDLHRRPKLQAGQGVGCISFPHFFSILESMTRVLLWEGLQLLVALQALLPQGRLHQQASRG